MLKSAKVTALGAMSGTSLDGVDVAVVVTDGRDIFSFGDTGYRGYTSAEQQVLRAALGKWQGDESLEQAFEITQQTHIEALKPYAAELIGFHGQTLAHDPHNRGTHQMGDGAVLARELNTPVVWDFRTADIEMGGEGAPLAPFFHHACARYLGYKEPVAFLNLGGVGNITFTDPRIEAPETEGAVLAFDTGPANAPINDLLQERLGQPYDKDGALARKGTVETGALELFLADPYFYKIPPKSLDRDAFCEMRELVFELSDADAAATLTGMAAASVLQAMDHAPVPPKEVLVTGGGRLNPVMMQMLQAALDVPVRNIDDTGLNGDMLEAQAFAYLAVRVARGLPTSCPSTTGVRASVGGGTLSKP
ncbi:anhydro-N-acetylmuramic acid kinase [Lentibacter algarum]|uniref:anhydro-N-acetylmuramic acid kinase n=1 Tax=Lentibacter algarum TaxID=576131 RepID=UPI001C097FD6|nr:anhydro-N-acetylmuramic acid kinase [Lentibacter algarum]MBU2982506.1 anhydro-N-acetylmuramic acid kinase [Lentibacter algarum]